MFDFCRRILFIGVAFVVIGCADNSERMDLRVGLFFTEDTRSLIIPYNFSHKSLMNKNDELRAGNDIVSVLTGATRRVFAGVEVLDSYPTKTSMADKRLNVAVVVQVIPMGGSFSYMGHGIKNSSDATNSLTAELTCFDSAMIEIAAISASGEGNAAAKGILFDSRKRAFVGAVKSATRNLGDDVALQMYSNPEIRKMAD